MPEAAVEVESLVELLGAVADALDPGRDGQGPACSTSDLPGASPCPDPNARRVRTLPPGRRSPLVWPLLGSAAISAGARRAVIQATATDHILDPSRQFGDRRPKWVGSAITHRLEVTVTISVNEQVPGHKVTVTPGGRAERSQRRASCECGWQSQIGSTEQVMPEIRTHLEAALAATQGRAEPPGEPGSSIFRP